MSDFFEEKSLLDKLTFESPIYDYISAYSKLHSLDLSPLKLKKLRIAFVCSFTISNIEKVFFTLCIKNNIMPEFYFSDYNQYTQDILDEKSKLYSFHPDITFLFIDSRALLAESYFVPYPSSEESMKKNAEEITNYLINLVDKLQKFCPKTVVHNLEIPFYSPLGIAENKEAFGFLDIFSSVNNALRKKYEENSSVFVFDFDQFLSKIGKENAFDYKMYYLGDMKIAMQIFPKLVNEYLAYLIPTASFTRRCIVLDLDNTLWGGNVGDDGFNGIQLGPKPPGNQFMDFQKHLLALHNRGILLAINSSNNYEEAMNVIEKHQFMVLKKKNFSSIKINWEPKDENMKNIAKEINIGLDSFVFIDDLAENRERIKELLPEVETIDMPEDPALYTKTLLDLKLFSSFAITEEDFCRGELYAQRSQRDSLRLSSNSMEKFLENLGLSVNIAQADLPSIPRISQLCMKTNQFNVTTRRYSESDIKAFYENNNCVVYQLDATDRFGDHGLVGVCIIKKEGDKAFIDSFLLSCRVMGFHIENAFYNYVADDLKKQGITSISSLYIPTTKNSPVKDLYASFGFSKAKENDDGSVQWDKSLQDFTPEYPKWILMEIKK